MSRSEHARLSLDGKTINPSWEKQLTHNRSVRGLILHDYNLGAIDGAYELLNENLSLIIPNPMRARIGMKFPTQVNTEEDLIKWLQIPNSGSYYYLQYNGILTTNNTEFFVENRDHCRAQVQTTINPIYGMTYEEFTTSGIITLFKSILDLRRYRIVFPLIYDKAFFINEQWIEVIKLFNLFINHNIHNIANDDYYKRVMPFETLYAYCKTITIQDIVQRKAIISKDKVQHIFQFVRETNYDLFKMFYEYTGEMK